MVKFKGFTLIELMIVMAIIGILASIILPAINDMKADSPTINTEEDNEYSGSVIIINGVKHSCDTFGDCKPIK